MIKSQKLFTKAKTVLPGGVNSPVRAFRSVNLDPVFIKSAKGSRIKDVDAMEYIDYVGSWGPMILGHAHEEVLNAIRETAANGTSFGAPTELETKIAEKIVSMVQGIEMVRMVNSGTEATMSAVRLARGITGRDKIIKFTGCYHGHGDSFLIKAGSGALTYGEPDSPGVPKNLAQDTLNAAFNDINSVEELFAKFPGQISAVIVEPIAGNMGVIPPKEGFLEGLRKICTRYGSLLIFDEVMTGFRVAKGGTQSIYNVMPDLTVMGKVIGGGLPSAAYGGKKEIMQHISPEGPVYQAGTLSGNPLAMAAGLKTLEIIDRKGFFEELNRKSTEFFENTRKFIDQKNLPLSVNYVNSMGCLFFNKKTVENFEDVSQCDIAKFSLYFKKMLSRGIYLAPSQYEAMFLSAAHTEKDLELTFENLKDVLEEIYI